jgi:hypothetical protein
MCNVYQLNAGPDLRGAARAIAPRPPRNRKIESTDFIETFASLKSRKLICFLVIKVNTNNSKGKKKIFHGLYLLLLIGVSTFCLPRGPHKCKSGLGSIKHIR